MPWWALALRITGLGWYVAFCIILGVVGGLWLDRRFHTLPAFTLAGTVAGTAVAFYGMYKAASELLKQQDRKKSDRGES